MVFVCDARCCWCCVFRIYGVFYLVLGGYGEKSREEEE